MFVHVRTVLLPWWLYSYVHLLYITHSRHVHVHCEDRLIKYGNNHLYVSDCTVHPDMRIFKVILHIERFFLYTLSRLVCELTHNTQQGGHETRGVGEGRTKQW